MDCCEGLSKGKAAMEATGKFSFFHDLEVNNKLESCQLSRH